MLLLSSAFLPPPPPIPSVTLLPVGAFQVDSQPGEDGGHANQGEVILSSVS